MSRSSGRGAVRHKPKRPTLGDAQTAAAALAEADMRLVLVFGSVPREEAGPRSDIDLVGGFSCACFLRTSHPARSILLRSETANVGLSLCRGIDSERCGTCGPSVSSTWSAGRVAALIIYGDED